MKDTCYLIVSKDGVHAMRKTRPDLRGGQHAVLLEIQIDDGFFRQIVPTATLEIGKEFVIKPDFNIAVVPEPPPPINKKSENKQ